MKLNISPDDFFTDEFQQALGIALEKALAKLQPLGSSEPGNRLLLSATDASKTLGICEKSLWSMTVPRGNIPVVRVGSRRLYSRDSLKKWAAEQEAKGMGGSDE